MRDILAKTNLDVLAQFASSEVLLAFDFDGTLAPLVREPNDACIRPSTRELLVRLSSRYPCIVLSGRAVADVRPRLTGLGFLHVIGNHGLEPGHRESDFQEIVSGWLPVLQRHLGGLKGVVIEDKGSSLAVHYRKSRERVAARRAILEAAGTLHPLRVIGGKQVVNLLPAGAPHKGLALRGARERLACDTAIYVGDDETDEDVFALDEPGRLLGVRVGHSTTSRAAFFLQRQGSIDALIAELLAQRSATLKPTAEAR